MLCEVCRSQPALEYHGVPLRSLSGERAGPYCRACLLEEMGPWLDRLKTHLRATVPGVSEEQLVGVGDWVIDSLLSSPYPGDDAARADWIAQRWKAAGREPPTS
jgi:hypothetical protein